jgi:hypothetical protein
MRSFLHTGASLQVKIVHEGDIEKTIGYATGLTFTVSQGQKMIYTVDSPFPQEIAQGAGPSFVRGSMMLFLPKGTTMERAGLVPYRQDAEGLPNMAASKFFGLRIYDRATTELVLSVDYCKVSTYTVSMQSRQVVRISVNFEGIYLTPGNGV